MSSSTDPAPLRVVRPAPSAAATGLPMPDLRTGRWTRLGADAVLGDDVTEQLLDGLAESTRSAARAQGYAVGWAEGRREAEAAAQQLTVDVAARAEAEERRREAEHQEALAALAAAATALRERTAEVCAAVDEQAATLALELTTELVGRAAADAAEHAVRRVVGLLPDHPVARVRLHPDVAATAADLREQGVTVVADPSLGRGDALVEADTHVVDLRLDTALDRLREVLG
ncbi:FliH/SctL family protein [Nocardioides sp. GCM10027113]|uniref:FliH/SctL family protein n=1 Tax=unclassified Nocardioides TaxID=2615069 RepID=UPI00360675E2